MLCMLLYCIRRLGLVGLFSHDVATFLTCKAGVQDIGSGNCFVHNVQLYDHVQKSVLWVPWRLHPTHSYDTRNRNLPALARAIMHYVASPGLFTLVPAAMAALRG